MAKKPIILAVDDETDVLSAVELDLRHKYSEHYRILKASSGELALDLLQRIKDRNEAIALFLIDQRMPRMTGIELLTQAVTLFPDAKRVLLTAYSDTEVAIRAINEVRLDYYLTKPWDPPEEQLYPMLNDLLSDWRANYQPEFEGVRVIGTRWSSQTHQLKEFLARNQIPFRWLDVETAPEAQRYINGQNMPIVVLPDDTLLAQPNPLELATHLGLQTRAELPYYDLAIIGGGPAGLAAAVYGASEGLSTVLIEKHAPGGQAGTSSRIENYLGFPVGLSGADLARRAVTQARRFGVEILAPQEVRGITLNGIYRVVHLLDGSAINARAILIATGVSYRKLGASGIERLTGAGVYYGAALTEASLCKDQHIYIVGGANSAGQAAMHFANHARCVTMLVRSTSLQSAMSRYLIDQIEATPNIEVRTRTNVVAAHGDTNLTTLTLQHIDGEEDTVPADALFIFIGANPGTDWLDGVVLRNSSGYILSGSDLLINGKYPATWTLKRDPYLLETSVPGIFVAGDVRHHSVKRVASAVGEGSISVQFIHQYLGGL
ncbi:MAG: FAD-dependent oxidoreductase [Anaerolineae bacterium]|nr:FAD-dependent oxidoreductase [Anaerolineae bacterium]